MNEADKAYMERKTQKDWEYNERRIERLNERLKEYKP